MDNPSSLTYRRVLVATGGAAHSQVAVERAAQVAQLLGAALHVVAVVPQGRPTLESMAAAFPGGGNVDSRVLRDDQERVAQHLRETSAALRAQGLEVQEHLMLALKPAEAILSVAREVEADLIVLGRRHTSAWSAALAGSVSDMVSHASPVDVLVAR